MTITYAKLRSGEWGVRGPSDQITEGADVSVAKRDGTVRTETVRKIYFDDGRTAIASVHDAARVRGGRQTRVRAQASRVAVQDPQTTLRSVTFPPPIAPTEEANVAARAIATRRAAWQAAQAELAAERAQAETRREAMDAGSDFRAQLRAMLGE